MTRRRRPVSSACRSPVFHQLLIRRDGKLDGVVGDPTGTPPSSEPTSYKP